MKKKILKFILLAVFIIITLCAAFNIYKWIVSGKQTIKISTAKQAYTNSELYVSTIVKKNGMDIDAKTKLQLLDSNGKKVKKAKVKYDGNTGTITIPDIETGNYYIKAKVSSKAGIDTVKQAIYITNANMENIIITQDKGIYKPGDVVSFRALLTAKKNDEPIKEDVNISIYDGNDNKVYNENVVSSDYGIVSGSFKPADEVNSGIYKLVVKTDKGEKTKQFKVNPYVTPKYEIKITTDKQNYLVGDTAKLNIKSEYFFGEPASNAKYEIYIDNELYKEAIADANGVADVEYEIKTAKAYNIKVEAVDKSNYFAEATSSFSAGTDIFEIELLPEFGSLVAGEKNNIYVITKTADGNPIKTYLTINADKFTKQVATDENGIGKFSIDVDSITNDNNQFLYVDYAYSTNYNKYSKKFVINAENENGEKVKKSISLNIENKNILLSTDKVKYNQGEDIKINIFSLKDSYKNIYFFKNKQLIKMITTDMPDTTVNLDDVYGLIDIYITEENNISSYYYNKNTYKKTVFIKPTKALNIEIKTDKEEYKPGENISISIGTKDENNNNVESALLVSMLDNSVLNLAKNDLSIDNIKLALQDIQFSDELDAATLYASIIDDSSSSTLTALLLKQKNTDENISENIIDNYEEKENAKEMSIILILLIVLMVVVYLLVKFKKTKKAFSHLLNIVIWLFILISIVGIIIDEYFWRDIDFNGWTVAITAIIGLTIYILWISKLNKKIIRTSISILISCVVYILLGVAVYQLDASMPIILTIFASLILVGAILSKIKKLQSKKFFVVTSKEAMYILKFICAILVALLVGAIIEKLTEIYEIGIPITIIATYFTNYWLNIKNSDKVLDETHESKKTTNYVTPILATIGIITMGYLVLKGIGSNRRYYNDLDIIPIYTDSSLKGTDGMWVEDAAVDSSEPRGFSSLIINPTTSSTKANASGDRKITNEVKTEEMATIGVDLEEAAIDENIRNVFLESMCFIPEAITENGNKQLDLKLSDNITTWTIQTVGNTKDGKVGYGILDTVKVFKEFFVDFELPANLLEKDQISIPVTVYNYTNEILNTTLKIKEEAWLKLNNNDIKVTINPNSSKMIYIPIEILEKGTYKFRIEATSNALTDIIEKEAVVATKGYKVEKVISAGILDQDIEEDVLVLEDIIENTALAKVKIYAGSMAQNVEGMENIFRMPTGCFEQVSSSLYPNILALKYIEDNNIVNDELKNKALNYISSGYQKILTYEVPGEKGGFSLYGHSPAETVLTAYGLMEITDLKEVYSVDDNVIERMTDFLYKKQNINGSFTITGSHVGGAGSREELALNAYITWALSESNPKHPKLAKSVEYLKDKLDKVDDNYTLALIANVLANVNDKDANKVVKRLVSNTNVDGNRAYISSNVVDYYGCGYNYQTMQTVSLTSMALSKTKVNNSLNKQLINYLIGQKDTYGTWHSTQATILALKALNAFNEKGKIKNQTIKVSVNSDIKEIEIKDNPLEIYELVFNNLGKENKLNIDMEKGNAYYEVVEEYYIPYENVDTSENNIEIDVQANQNLKVNEILTANIKLVNKNKETIRNGMVTIDVPAGCSVLEDSLALLETKGIIEKYEMTYRKINIYLRDFEVSQVINLSISFRTGYPVEVTGLAIRAYDYYNPNICGNFMPVNIKVTD